MGEHGGESQTLKANARRAAPAAATLGRRRSGRAPDLAVSSAAASQACQVHQEHLSLARTSNRPSR